MKNVLIAALTFILVGCQTKDNSVDLPTSCNSTSDPTGEIAAINTLVYSYPLDLNPTNYPIGLAMRLAVSVNSLTSKDEVKGLRLFYPDGSYVDPGYAMYIENNNPYLLGYNIGWKSYVGSTVNKAPATGYCVAIVTSNNSLITKTFGLETDDGTLASSGSSIYHPSDTGLMQAGDFSPLEVPVITSSTYNSGANSFDMTFELNDTRITELEIGFYDDNGDTQGYFMSLDLGADLINNTGSNTKVFDAINLDTSSSNGLNTATYARVTVYDSGNGSAGYVALMSEVGALSNTHWY